MSQISKNPFTAPKVESNFWGLSESWQKPLIVIDEIPTRYYKARFERFSEWLSNSVLILTIVMPAKFKGGARRCRRLRIESVELVRREFSRSRARVLVYVNGAKLIEEWYDNAPKGIRGVNE